jgi:hypothetical protein
VAEFATGHSRKDDQGLALQHLAASRRASSQSRALTACGSETSVLMGTRMQVPIRTLYPKKVRIRELRRSFEAPDMR